MTGHALTYPNEQPVDEIETPTAIYSSRIIKASALIPDTKVLLSEWNLALSVADNLDRLQRENVFGKASRRRVSDILVIFRQRFFADPDVGAALVTLVQEGAPDGWISPLLYFFAAQNDRTLRDMVTEVVYPRQMAGFTDIPIEYTYRAVRNWVAEGKTTSQWGESTIQRVSRNSLATLRDFGLLDGTVNKRIVPIYLPTQAFALIAHWMQTQVASGNLILHHEDWKLFFLSVAGVERFFIEAHQEHLLNYQAAGSIVRIDFPAPTLAEYAHVLVAGTT